MDHTEFIQKNKKGAIDAVRLYEGDIRIRDQEGNLHGQSSDPLYGDIDAYRTLNALLFPGISNEFARIQKEGKKLNPVFLERMDETLNLYCRIFQLMCWEHKKKDMECRAVRRIERQDSLILLEQGQTLSFLSASKSEFNKEFAKKDGVILLEIYVSSDVPYLDFKKALGIEYKNIGEQEVLLAPFVDIAIKETDLTSLEKRTIKDLHGKPPKGKYKIYTLGIQDFRKENKGMDSLEYMKSDILQKKDISLEAINAMNKGEWDKDFSEYTRWKEQLQRYLKCELSDMWYRGNNI